MAKNYVNGPDFLRAIQEYRRKKREDPSKEYPEIEYIGECILKIAEKYSHNSWFRGYHFRDEMVSEALIHCMKAFRNGNFNEIEKDNPFAYFTTICKNAFFQYMHKEQNYSAVKLKILESNLEQFSVQNGDNPNMYKNTFIEYTKKESEGFINDTIKAVDDRREKIKQNRIKNKK